MNKVKRLDWKYDKSSSTCAEAKTIVGVYGASTKWKTVFFSPANVKNDSGRFTIGNFDNLDEAKAACQAHFEQLILECLENEYYK